MATLYLSLLCLFIVSHLGVTVHAQLQVGFYSATCPPAEFLITNALQQAFFRNRGIAAGLVRMHFHDCFVRGCDGSVLIDGQNSEKQSIPNLSLRGFEVIDAAKSQVEAVCPGVVSCADILAFAARDSVVVTGGPSWRVPAGRRDGNVSLKSEPLQFLPPPTANVQTLTQFFSIQQLSQDEMITLSGAHTIGVSHCASFIGRLYNFSSTSSVDPTLNQGFARILQQFCPSGNPNPNTTVSMDSVTPNRFDNTYYTNLRFGRGLFTSDQTLFTDPTTRGTVLTNSINTFQWRTKFRAAMIKMSSIGVLTGTQGEIRKNCRIVNSS